MEMEKFINVTSVTVAGKKRLRLDFGNDESVLVYIKRFKGIEFQAEEDFWHIPADTNLKQLQESLKGLLELRAPGWRPFGSGKAKNKKQKPAAKKKRVIAASQITAKGKWSTLIVLGVIILAACFFKYYWRIYSIPSALGVVLGCVFLLAFLLVPVVPLFGAEDKIAAGKFDHTVAFFPSIFFTMIGFWLVFTYMGPWSMPVITGMAEPLYSPIGYEEIIFEHSKVHSKYLPFAAGDKGKVPIDREGLFYTLLSLYLCYQITLFGCWWLFSFVSAKPVVRFRVGMAALIAATPLLLLLATPSFIPPLTKPVNMYINNHLTNVYASIVYKAMIREDQDFIRQLAESGVDIDARNTKGNTILLELVSGNWKDKDGRYRRARFLVENGADVNAGNSKGETPFILATVNNDKETIRLLAENGADINAQDDKGRTALHNAKHFSAYHLLIELGVDVNILDNKGNSLLAETIRNPMRHAREEKRKLIDALKNAGANR